MKIPVSLAVLILPAIFPAAAAEEPGPAEALPIVEKAIAFHGGDRFEASETSFVIASRRVPGGGGTVGSTATRWWLTPRTASAG